VSVSTSIQKAALTYKKYGIQELVPPETPMAPGQELNAMLCPDTEPPIAEPYRAIVGSLLWWVTTCRPDMAYAIGQLCRVTHKPSKQAWKAAIHCLRYAIGTADLGILFPRGDGSKPPPDHLDAFADASWANVPGKIGDSPKKNPDAFKSTSGHLVRANKAPVSWSSGVQKAITLSSTQSELYETVECGKSIHYIRQAYQEQIGSKEVLPPTTLREDNRPVLDLLDPDKAGLSKRVRHISIRWFAAREWVQEGSIAMAKIDTHYNLADIMTKPLTKDVFLRLREGFMTLPGLPANYDKFDRAAGILPWAAS